LKIFAVLVFDMIDSRAIDIGKLYHRPASNKASANVNNRGCAVPPGIGFSGELELRA